MCILEENTTTMTEVNSAVKILKAGRQVEMKFDLKSIKL